MKLKAKPLIFDLSSANKTLNCTAKSIWGTYLICIDDGENPFSCWFIPTDGDKSFIGEFSNLGDATKEMNRINEKSINLKLSKYVEYIEGLYEV
jgi:hypothetical protein